MRLLGICSGGDSLQLVFREALISMSLCRVFAAHGSGSEMNIVNNEGMTVLTLKSKSFSAHNKWYIFSGSSTDKADKIATVKPEEGSQTAQVEIKL